MVLLKQRFCRNVASTSIIGMKEKGYKLDKKEERRRQVWPSFAGNSSEGQSLSMFSALTNFPYILKKNGTVELRKYTRRWMR
jgi:hypothetical protein